MKHAELWTHQGSSEEPGPGAWREPPAVEPLTFRLEYEKVVYDKPWPKGKRGSIPFCIASRRRNQSLLLSA